MSTTYFKDKDVFEKLINETLTRQYGFNKEIVLITNHDKYKKSLESCTVLYNDVINIIDEYTIEEKIINIETYIRCDYIIFKVKYYNLFDCTISYNFITKIDDCCVFDVTSKIIYTKHGNLSCNMTDRKLNIHDYDEKFKTELQTKLADDKLNKTTSSCNYINFFNEYMKRQYNEHNYIKCLTLQNEDGYHITNNDYVIYHYYNGYNYKLLYYYLIQPLNHKKLKKIIIMLKLLIDTINEQILLYKKLKSS